MLLYRVFLFSLCVVLGGCFKPLHHYDGQKQDPILSKVKVSDVSGVLGYRLRHELVHAITPFGQPAQPEYVLNVSITTSKASLGILKDATASRHVSKITANYTLIQTADYKTLITGSTNVSSNYSVLSAPSNRQMDNTSHFRTIVAKEGADKRALKRLAQDIRVQLAMRLKRIQREEIIDSSKNKK